MDHTVHTFNFWEGDLAGDGHDLTRHNTLSIFTEPHVTREELLDNLATNLQALSFDLKDLFTGWNSPPTAEDLTMMSELQAKGFLKYITGLNGAMSKTQALILSAYYMPLLISTLLLIREDGSFVGGSGSFTTSRARSNWVSRPSDLSSDVNDILGARQPINYAGITHHETAVNTHF